jgi:hypothetical protein
MIVTSVRATALAGVLLAAVALPAQACHNGCGAPAAASSSCDSSAPASAATTSCAPVVRTIQVQEWVPETYMTTVTRYRTENTQEAYTAYKMECVAEKYTSYRTECVSETRARTVSVNRLVPEVREVTSTVYTCVPTVEQRTVARTVVTCNPVTVMVSKCVDQGHFECREVEDTSLCARIRKRCHKPSCCEPCPPVITKTVKVWCPNMVTVQVPVTRMERVCSTVNETINVTVNKMVATQQVNKVTVYKCVTEQKEETYTVLVPRQVAFEATRNVMKSVPYQATRTISRAVPYTEQVQATRMVSRTVERQVTDSCSSDSYSPGITVSGHGVGGHRLFGKSRGHGHHGVKGCCN